MKHRNQKGFTLIELVLVITILGILAVVALPNFIDVSTSAKQSTRDGTAGAVRTGIANYRANDLVQNGPPGSYPATLDSASNAACASDNLCFTTILAQGVADGSWTKNSDTEYVFSDGTTSFTYTYDTTTGTLSCPDAP